MFSTGLNWAHNVHMQENVLNCAATCIHCGQAAIGSRGKRELAPSMAISKISTNFISMQFQPSDIAAMIQHAALQVSTDSS